MNNTKFTPGPWVTVNVGHDKTLIRQARDCSGIEAGYIGEVYFSRPGRYKPNTALIAAAPELYEALDEAVKDLVAYQVNARMALKSDSRWEGVSELVQPTIDSSRSALAKARGDA